ncbi:MAG: class IV adenylate cyclase [Promethearchaeota archaeon]
MIRSFKQIQKHLMFSLQGLNMIEAEIKVRISSIKDMENKLLDLGAKFQGCWIHEDHYFDMPPKLGSFIDTDEALRLRISRDNETGEEQHFMTYKGKKLDNETKSREEINLRVEDCLKVKKILVNLGFRAVIVVKKTRHVYKMGEILITLDEIELLDQPFMEVEILAKDDAQFDDAVETLFNFLKKLGIERSASERKSYLELILEKLIGKSRRLS